MLYRLEKLNVARFADNHEARDKLIDDGYILIEDIAEAAEQEEEPAFKESSQEPAEEAEPMNADLLTVEQLKEWLTERGVEFAKRATRPELLKLVYQTEN